MKHIKLYITLLFVFVYGFTYTQQYTNYTTKDGLPSNHVYRITQDAQGFIWFITDKGMLKYNGTDFKKFSIREGLPINDIWNIVATPNGKVWYFSKSPKIGYIEKDSIYAFPSAIKGDILYPMNRNVVGNAITFNNSFAYYQLENKKWKPYNVFGSNSSSQEYRTYLTHDTLERFQLAKDRKHLLFVNKNNKAVKEIKITQEILNSHTRGQINDSTYIWLSDKFYTVLTLNNFKLKMTYYKDAISVKETKYTRMHIVNNQIQITGKGFVAVLDANYNLVNTHYIPNHLKDHFSFIDKQNNLWVASFTSGVFKLPVSKQNANYTLVNEKVGRIKKIDNLLLTTVLDKGFYQYDSITKKFKPYIKETDFAYGVYQIPVLNKKYFITNKKITSIQHNKKRVFDEFKNKSTLNEIARQLVYHNNYLYGNFTAGLNKLNPDNLNIKKEYLLNGIRTFVSFKDLLVVATSNGLKNLKNDSIITIEIDAKTPNNLHKKPILSLNKLDANSLLVGTDAYGAFITDLTTITPLKETAYLSINDSFMEGDNLWLATDQGIWHYKKEADNKYIFITTYNQNEGLLLKNAKSVYATNKNLIISSNIGVAIIPKKKNNNKHLLAIYVSNGKYNDEKIISKTVKYATDNTISFSIASIDFSENPDFSYQYQLFPLQKEWVATTSKQLLFNDLPPNNYKLHIKAKNKHNLIKFKIQPLWYQTLFSKVFFGVLFLSLIIGAIFYIRKIELKKQATKLNAKRKLAEFELNALRSQMNPHFVFNSLNAIQYYMNDNKIELSEKYLVKFSKLIRMFFDFSAQQEISIEDEIKLLNGYLEIEKLRFGKDFKYSIQLDKNLTAETKIPAMLLQPIVENAVNHGLFHKHGKGNISITFSKKEYDSFEINIEDDGVGRTKATHLKQQMTNKHLSKSTHILTDRISLLNKSNIWNITYQIDDVDTINKTGTRVRLLFVINTLT